MEFTGCLERIDEGSLSCSPEADPSRSDWRRLEQEARAARSEVARLSNALSESVRAVASMDMERGEAEHRAKNMLQLAASLLQLEATTTREPTARAVIAAAAGRLGALAGVTASFSATRDSTPIALAAWVERLCAALPVPPRVTVKVEVADQTWPASEAAPLGLFVSEAVSNALKHAFPNERAGCVRVVLQPAGPDRLKLLIADDGIGPGPGAAAGSGVGVRIMRALAARLGGSLVIEPGPEGLGCSTSAELPARTLAYAQT